MGYRYEKRVGAVPALVDPDSVVPASVVPDSVVPDSVVPDSVVPDSVVPMDSFHPLVLFLRMQAERRDRTRL